MSGLRTALAIGEPLVGTVLTLPGAVVAELIAEPFDFVWIDLEHGALGAAEAQELVLGAQAAGAFALVRLSAGSERLLAAMADAGADGIVLASVDGPETAAAAVARTRHPPAGRRGYGLRRAGTRGRSRGGAGSERPSVWAQIETLAGVAAAGAIAQVEGVDAVVVGTADLSFAVGAPCEIASAPLLAAVAEVRAAVAAVGTTAFGVAGALDGASDELTRGAGVLVHATDARICARAADRVAAHLTGRLAREPREVTR